MMSSVWRVSLMLLCNMAATNTIQRVTVNIPGKRQKQTNNIFIGLLLTYQVEDRRRKEKRSENTIYRVTVNIQGIGRKKKIG